MELSPLLQTANSLTLFIAPPAWGKTSLLLQMPRPWIFISPLRALAEEFAARVAAEGGKVKLLRQRAQQEWLDFVAHPSGILIATPETLPTNLPLTILNQCSLVLDEFHLFQKWGETFRPLLREQLYAWANQGARILGLSATMDTEQMDEIQQWSRHAFEQVIVVNIGNMSFLHRPKKILGYGNNLAMLQRRIMWQAKHDQQSGIVFCHSRAQVRAWAQWFGQNGIHCLACVGGEVADFRLALAKDDQVAWIVATSALSHGVNLPSFKHVFIAHRPDSRSMWLQMAARGGRRGEDFFLHCMDKTSLWQKIKLHCFDVLVRTHLYLRV